MLMIQDGIEVYCLPDGSPPSRRRGLKSVQRKPYLLLVQRRLPAEAWIEICVTNRYHLAEV